MKKYIISSLLVLLSIIFISCEDTAPTEYKQNFVVEGLLIVGEPIGNIKILETQSLRDSFVYDNSIVRNAKVTITSGGKSYELEFDTVKQSYVYADKNELVKELTEYQLKIELKDGKVFTGRTFTPKTFEWIKDAPDYMQYPQDTINLPSDYDVSWTKADTTKFYVLRIVPLDTLNYGKYLNPQTEELNRRIMRSWIRKPEFYFRELTNWTFLPTTEVPVVWNSFKWFGINEVTVFAPDANFLNWTLQTFFTQELVDLLSSIDGGAYGYFGSATMIKDTSFVLKNQP